MLGGHITPFLGKGSKNFIWPKHPELIRIYRVNISDFGKKTNPTLKDYINQSISGALKSTGVKGENID